MKTQEKEYHEQEIKWLEDRIDIISRCDGVEFRTDNTPNADILYLSKNDGATNLFINRLIAQYKLEIIDVKRKLWTT